MSPPFSAPSRRSLLTLIALLFLWPKFVVIAPSVSPYTLAVLICITLSAVILFLSRSGNSRLMPLSTMAVILFCLFFFVRFCADLVSETTANSVYYDFRDFAWGGSLFFIAAILARDPDTHYQISKIVCCSAFVILLCALVEQILRLPFPNLIIQYLPIYIDDQFMQMLVQDKSREGAFRSQAFFSHPIVLGQVSASIFPIALGIFLVGRSRLICALAMASCVAAIYFSGSRSGFIALMAGVICLIVLFIGLSRSRNVFTAAAVLLPLAILALPVAVTIVETLATGRSTVEQRSTDMRARMWESGEAAIRHSPIIGYGAGNSANLAGVRARFGSTFTIDDYYLSIILDGGYLTFFSLTLFIFLVFLITLNAGGSKSVRLSRAGFFSAIVSILVGCKATSITEGMAFAYIYAGLIVSSYISKGSSRRRLNFNHNLPSVNAGRSTA